MNIESIIVASVFIFIFISSRIINRGFFWRARDGEELSFKQFLIRWKSGIVDITPLQQTKTSLWSMIPIFAGMFWGMAVTFIGGVYWMTLILTFSLPLMFVNFIGTYQKYKSQKIAYEAFNEAMKPTKRNNNG